ncbi:MAG: hypothetical protein QOI13_3435 [Paraburkholderia sp.]|nr:hypothetical protein [Paraburkholderia sp.]
MQIERFHSTLRRCARNSSAQRGATSVVVALFLVVALAALGAIDVGNDFFARRSLQRIADLGALAGVQTIDGGCRQAAETVTENAAANGFSANASGQTLNVVCGRWDTRSNSAPSYFSSTNGGAPLNAVQVTATRQVPYFFLGPARTISATATAQATNLGAFTVGTALAQLQGGLVNGVLSALLGTNLGLSLVSYESLANARISVGDLMVALGVGTVNELLSAQVSAAELAQLMLTALSRTSIVDVNLRTDLATLQAIVNSGMSSTVQIPLGNTNGTPGLLSLGVSDAQSAIDATISPFDALIVAAEIAQNGHALRVAGGLNLGSLVTTTLSLQVLEPPVLAIGEAGIDLATGTWRTQASTAQIRLYLDLSLTVPLVASVDVPLSLEAAQGQAWLESTNCTSSSATSSSVIGGQTGIANLCIANRAATQQAVSQPFSCPAAAANIVTGPLGIPLVTARVSVPLVGSPINPPLTFIGTTGGYQSFGTAVGQALVNALSASLTIDGISLSALTSLLAPVLTSLDVIDPLLQMLGVQVGVTTVHDLSLTCGVSKLVY